MPKRKKTIRFPSDEVQGEGSWVLVTLPTVEEMRKIRKTYREAEEAEKDTFEIGVELLKRYVKEWNWVMEDDSAMPQPREDPTVIEKLTNPESGFLSRCIVGTEQDAKN